jgi:hypothetical protein
VPGGGPGSAEWFQRLLPETPTPERCVEAYPQRTRFESIAEWKLRQRQLTEDGNLEIGGAGLAPTADSRRSPGLPQTAAVDLHLPLVPVQPQQPVLPPLPPGHATRGRAGA